MKFKLLLIGLALALMLCISPVSAGTSSGAGYEAPWDEYGHYEKYRYRALYNQSEEYITIWTEGTLYCDSFVSFRPANIPDAPTMVVRTHPIAHMKKYDKIYFYLPRSVDEWVIKYYSFPGRMPNYYDDCLKNKGVFNLNELFGEYISKGSWLELQLSRGQYIWCPDAIPYGPEIDIPDV
ncbi:MAG TPA: hypothetical protein O0X21_03780 [Methanocorpusculum sp.]|nr:hypothetical protein [Methanocorpusculum sp.]